MLSEPDLFRQIIGVLRQHRDIAREPDQVIQRKLWRLLARLQFRWGETQSRLRERLLVQLRSFVDNPDTAEATLRSLLTALAERATGGDASIEAEAFFAEHGLRGVPLGRRQWPRLVEAGAEQLERDLSFLFGYGSATDVRPSGVALLDIPEVDLWRRGVASFLILTGESGQGKTWRLCALAHFFADNAPVVVVSAAGDARRVAEDAAHKFWSGLCNRNAPLRLDQIARHLRDTGAAPPGAPWLYVMVDGVNTMHEALALYREIGGVDGVRLAFTTPTEVAERLAQGPGAPHAVVMPVQDFTEAELRRYVAGNDAVRWHAVPKDVQRVIRRPLLAWIYRTLAGEGGWDAKNEYALYDGYFRRHLVTPLRDEGFAAPEVPLARAGLALWDGESYPWTARQMLEEFNFPDALVAALLRLGFLRRNAQDRLMVWHDRLKEWLVAYALAEVLEAGDRDAQEVGRRCRDLLFQDPSHQPSEAEQRLLMRYVPMDVCWHLAQRLAHDPAAADALDTLLRRMEEDTIYFRAYEALYAGLLPTIGAAIAPVVFRRLHEVGGEQNDWVKRRAMKKCLASLDTHAVVPAAIGLLEHEEEDVRRAGAEILQHRPDPAALPFLWKRYRTLRHEREVEEALRRAGEIDNDATKQFWSESCQFFRGRLPKLAS